MLLLIAFEVLLPVVSDCVFAVVRGASEAESAFPLSNEEYPVPKQQLFMINVVCKLPFLGDNTLVTTRS
jgi:hypothetical protein